MRKPPANNHFYQSDKEEEESSHFVRAEVIADKYGITTRYVYQLAADQKIPSIRLGPKCIRFAITQVAKALEGNGGAA